MLTMRSYWSFLPFFPFFPFPFPPPAWRDVGAFPPVPPPPLLGTWGWRGGPCLFCNGLRGKERRHAEWSTFHLYALRVYVWVRRGGKASLFCEGHAAEKSNTPQIESRVCMFVPGKIYTTSSTTLLSTLFWSKQSSKFDKIICPNTAFTLFSVYPTSDLWCNWTWLVGGASIWWRFGL